MPRVFTWYGAEDVGRLMAFSFQGVPEKDLLEAIPLSEDKWKAAVDSVNNELGTMPLPLQKKWARFFEGKTSIGASDLIGSTGLNRVIFSPELLESVTRRYGDLQDCFRAGVPAADEAKENCWREGLPKSSTLVKTVWLNSASRFKRFDTDAASLQKLFADPAADWAQGAELVNPPQNIVTAKVGAQTFLLGGIHIVSKELDDWLWLTAWWSADADSDFGEDRPDFVKALGAPWNQYKICAVSSFTQDPKELDAIALTHPGLAAAYRVVLDAGLSWCSNPYIEKGRHNPRTNCIGCHQYAGTQLDPQDMIENNRLPQYGNSKTRETFPTDYIWTATQGVAPWLDTLNSQLFFRQPPSAAVKP